MTPAALTTWPAAITVLPSALAPSAVMRSTCVLLGALYCCAAEQVALGADATIKRHGSRSDANATALMRERRRGLASASATYNGTVADAAAYSARLTALRAALLSGRRTRLREFVTRVEEDFLSAQRKLTVVLSRGQTRARLGAGGKED